MLGRPPLLPLGRGNCPGTGRCFCKRDSESPDPADVTHSHSMVEAVARM